MAVLAPCTCWCAANTGIDLPFYTRNTPLDRKQSGKTARSQEATIATAITPVTH